VQAFGVKQTNGVIDFKVHLFTRFRRQSLHQAGPSLDLGAQRWVPYLADAQLRYDLAPAGDFLHIVFPQDVSSPADPTPLRAYVPTLNGGFAQVTQIANPNHGGVVVAAKTAVFPCPANVKAGTVYVERIDQAGVPVVPVGSWGVGAAIWPFVPSWN
jgi:hypothetical protein